MKVVKRLKLPYVYHRIIVSLHYKEMAFTLLCIVLAVSVHMGVSSYIGVTQTASPNLLITLRLTSYCFVCKVS